MSTRQPTTTMTGHLQWTHSGTVWATWRLSPVPYGMRPSKDKAVVRDLHRALWRSLHGEALLLGMMAVHDPTTVVERMLTGVDLAEHPQWAAECEATLDVLETVPMGERTMWLSVPLANRGASRFLEPARAALGGLRDQLALPRARPSRERIDARLAQAELVQRAIPAVFAPRPVTVAEQVWLAAHQQRRGLVDLPAPEPTDAATAALLAPRSGVALPEPVLDEGGQGDAGTSWRRLNPLSRRYLKITDPRAAADVDQPPSYQCLMAIADMPAGGMTFPGSEYLASLDRCGVDVDWAIRIRVNNREEVLKRTRKAVRNLNDQYEQRDGESTTGQHELDLAGQLLGDYQAAFANDKLEVEIEHTTILAVGDVDPDVAQDHAKTVAAVLATGEIALERPVGGIEDLWWQMHPGVPTSTLTRQLAQFTTAADYACVVPLTSSTLGDRAGILAAMTRSTSRSSPVLHELDGHTRQNVTASVAVCGELGAGKTFVLLSLAGAVVDRGGQLLAIDRSAEGEYARYARSLPEHVIIDVAAPTSSLDPLRVIADVAVAARAAQSFLTPLTGISAQSDLGDALAEVLEPRYLLEHQLRSLPQVLDHLSSEACEVEDATALARRIRSFARKDLGRVVFDESLPPMPLDCPAVVWLTNAVDLPTPDELTSPHLFRQLRTEKIFGRALYALIPALARQAMKVDRDRFTVLVCDEAHAINSSPEASREVTLFIREGRRANAAVLLGSHDAQSDFGDETQRGLIRTRIVLRHTDPELARRALVFLGLDPADAGFDAVVEALRFDTSPLEADGTGVRADRRGEGYMRDVRGGIEPIRILGPARADRRAAIVTTPGKAAR